MADKGEKNMSNFDSDTAAQVMLDGLTKRIREELRTRIMACIEPDIQSAINASLEAFEIAIKTYRTPEHLGDVIRVIIDRRDK